MTALRFGTTSTPVGTAVVAVTDEGLVWLDLTEAPPLDNLEPVMRALGTFAVHDQAAIAPIAAQLEEYFDGERTAFDVPIDWSLVRGFTRASLEAVCEIPYGETAAYGEVAITAGAPRAARAVGTACATTPLSIIVPVHRVVRSDGSLGEYGGRPDIKRHLVELERAHAGDGVRTAGV